MRNNFKISIFLLILFSYSITTYSQKTYKDSIKTYFKQIEDLINYKDNYKEDFLSTETLLAQKELLSGTEKINTLLKLYTVNVYKSIQNARKYNQEALQLAINIGYKKGELSAKYNQAYLLFIEGDFDTSMTVTEEVSKIVKQSTYPETYSDINTLKSYIYTERGEYDLALEKGLELLDIAEKSNDEYALMRAYASLSHYYLRIENYSKALSYCLKGLHYVIKLRKIRYIYPKIDEIARMTAKLNDTERALETYAFYLEIEKKISPPGSYIQSVVYMNMADIYISNNAYDNAQNYLSKALVLNYENNYKFRVPRALILQAELFLKTKDTVNSIINYEKSIEAAESINAFDVVKSNSAILANLYKKTNQLSKAYEYKTIHNSIRDSLFNNEMEQKIIILETRRKIKEVTQKKKILELENEAQKAKSNFILLLLIFILIIVAFIVFSYLKVKSKNRLLYLRTIELTKVQLEMEEKLNELENAKAILKEDTNNDTSLKSSKTTIDNDVKNIILNKLEKLEKELFFIDPNCSLRQVAQLLKTNPKYLSQVINQEKKSNFNNYINELRINYLLSRLLKDEDFRNSKLSYVAASIGYNNLNTFNAAFKKRQGILPSYFINELIQESKQKIIS
ncbi:helix-turn-helix domain-containing protein [Aquimarina longa]|uniref:helix-turn-helix domain-containing protein n=1 Tax=Aquimarina longa TaxID=1080221 RepID=UPI000781F9D1|nr:helix-turn-helix domain-containing protein [Aquimarina longa]